MPKLIANNERQQALSDITAKLARLEALCGALDRQTPFSMVFIPEGRKGKEIGSVWDVSEKEYDAIIKLILKNGARHAQEAQRLADKYEIAFEEEEKKLIAVFAAPEKSESFVNYSEEE